MKAPDWQHANEERVWEYIGWHLAKSGVETMLVGGAVAAIYTKGIYKSGDLDLINRSFNDDKLPKLMKQIGFEKGVSRYYSHPKCPIVIEFVSGPPGIGDDVKIQPSEKTVQGQTLYIYSPTDCIRDRLASYIHFNARECLDQAVLVAKAMPFNKDIVKKWCAAEGASRVYKEFAERLG